jgi:Cysteine-rich CPXCG
VEDTVRVRCPYCREWVDFYVDPDTTGALVEDCAVCCRPWAVTVERDGDRIRVHVSRAQ